MNNITGTLLRKNISVAQMAGYALSCLVGLSIILIAVKAYTDARGIIGNDEKNTFGSYIVVSKQVSFLGSNSVEFSQQEISTLHDQPWVKDVGAFTASHFGVYASVEFGGKGFSTALFFESVPDRFLDITPSSWKFTEDDKCIPVILPKDYLSLYNFGFAATRGMPKVSEEMIGLIPIRLWISGNGLTDCFEARIVGFSSRINTIAVPESFINYANNVYGSSDKQPTRLIVKTDNPANPQIMNYLDDNGYELNNGGENNAHMARILNLATTVVILIGAMITLLSLFIFILSLHLLLQKNRDKIHCLLMLGYTPAMIARTYHKIALTVNVLVLVAACVIMLAASAVWSPVLAEMGVESSSAIPAVITGTLIFFVITLMNFVTINRQVKRCFK